MGDNPSHPSPSLEQLEIDKNADMDIPAHNPGFTNSAYSLPSKFIYQQQQQQSTPKYQIDECIDVLGPFHNEMFRSVSAKNSPHLQRLNKNKMSRSFQEPIVEVKKTMFPYYTNSNRQILIQSNTNSAQ